MITGNMKPKTVRGITKLRSMCQSHPIGNVRRAYLYVVARVDEHSSRYQGLYPPCVALEIDRVKMLLV